MNLKDKGSCIKQSLKDLRLDTLLKVDKGREKDYK
jgi:hypothetical protein